MAAIASVAFVKLNLALLITVNVHSSVSNLLKASAMCRAATCTAAACSYTTICIYILIMVQLHFAAHCMYGHLHVASRVRPHHNPNIYIGHTEDTPAPVAAGTLTDVHA